MTCLPPPPAAAMQAPRMGLWWPWDGGLHANVGRGMRTCLMVECSAASHVLRTTMHHHGLPVNSGRLVPTCMWLRAIARVAAVLQ